VGLQAKPFVRGLAAARQSADARGCARGSTERRRSRWATRSGWPNGFPSIQGAIRTTRRAPEWRWTSVDARTRSDLARAARGACSTEPAVWLRHLPVVSARCSKFPPFFRTARDSPLRIRPTPSTRRVPPPARRRPCGQDRSARSARLPPERTERKKAKGSSIAAAGIECLANLFRPSERFASST